MQSPLQAHFAELEHARLHVPLVHSRSHSDSLLHASELPSAPSTLQWAAFEHPAATLPFTVRSQVDSLLHCTVVSAPAVPLHVALFVQAMVESAPVAMRHVAVLVQPTLHEVPQVALQLPVVHEHALGVRQLVGLGLVPQETSDEKSSNATQARVMARQNTARPPCP